jgi:hypothetical protein
MFSGGIVSQICINKTCTDQFDHLGVNCMLTSSIFRVGVFTIFACILVGCGGSGGPEGPKIEKQKTVPVSGILTYKGKPVANAAVGYHAIDGSVSARGTTDAAGTYTLTSYGNEPGAPPGKYKVTAAVAGTVEIEPGVLAPEPEGGFKSPIPSKYASPKATDIIVEVKEEGKNEHIIDLK